MAKHPEVAGETEVEAVAREIYVATVIGNQNRLIASAILDKSFEAAEAFVEYRKFYRQNTGKPKE